MTQQLETAVQSLGERLELAETRAGRMADWLDHKTNDATDTQRAAEHLAGIRDALREAQAWHRALKAQVPPFAPTR